MENKRKKSKETMKKQFNNEFNVLSRTETSNNSGNVRNNASKSNEILSGGRKVSRVTPQKRYRDREIAEEAMRLRQGMSEAEQRRKVEKERKKARLKRQRLQALVGLVAAFAIAVILLFMTPIFNIQEVRLSGNNTVPKELINEKIGYTVGANLFTTSASKIEEKMCEISLISEVEVKKHIFPAYLEVFITESKPAASLLCGSKTIVINSDLTVIDDTDAYNTDKLPSISGISVSDYELNTPLEFKSEEKREVTRTLLKSIESLGLIDMVTYISVDDLTSIKFNYDNRLEVHCGSQLELERKVRMFSEAIKTSTIKENSMGVIDVSVPGKASYES